MAIRHCLNAILYCSCFLEKWRIFTCNYVCTVTVFMTSEVAKFYWALSIKIQYHFNIGLSWRDGSLMLQSKYILVIGTKLFLPYIDQKLKPHVTNSMNEIGNEFLFCSSRIPLPLKPKTYSKYSSVSSAGPPVMTPESSPPPPPAPSSSSGMLTKEPIQT